MTCLNSIKKSMPPREPSETSWWRMALRLMKSVREVTALGAAYLAGLAVGFWQNLDELQEKAVIEREFRPGIETTERNYRYAGWKKAVKRAMAWEEHDE